MGGGIDPFGEATLGGAPHLPYLDDHKHHIGMVDGGDRMDLFGVT